MSGHQRTVSCRILLTLVCIGASATTTYNRSIRSVRGNVHFAIEAAGRRAIRAAEWRIALRQAGTEPIGLISAAAFCEDEVFLLDSRQAIVHRIHLPTGRQTGHIGSSTERADAPRRPRAMALDCAGHALYLIDRTGVFVFSLTSGRVERHFLQPKNFVYTGGNAVLDSAHAMLFVPGLWTSGSWSDWLQRDLDHAFVGDRLGYSLSLRDGATKPLFVPLERGCWAYSSSCLEVVFDEVRSDGPEKWVVAQRVSTQVGVFDSQYRLQRMLDVRSPGFLENGQRVGHSDSQADQTRWRENNSIIHNVYMFGNEVVTIHTKRATKDWIAGQPLDFEVYMNIHSLDGTALVSDVRLPDLPVVRDERNLYVIDYGPGGRRIGIDHVTLIRYPIIADRALFH